MERTNDLLKTRPMRVVESRLERPLEDYIRERYVAGSTQAEIARELGVNNATISRWMSLLGIEARFPGQRGRVA